jgi:hypothetical protein
MVVGYTGYKWSAIYLPFMTWSFLEAVKDLKDR